VAAGSATTRWTIPCFWPTAASTRQCGSPALAAYLWHFDTETGGDHKPSTRPFSVNTAGKAYYLLYNGILGDRTPARRQRPDRLRYLAHLLNATSAFWPQSDLRRDDPLRSQRGSLAENIEFKQIPYDVRVR
jgi:adenine-specific DNA-methyltransferase